MPRASSGPRSLIRGTSVEPQSVVNKVGLSNIIYFVAGVSCSGTDWALLSAVVPPVALTDMIPNNKTQNKVYLNYSLDETQSNKVRIYISKIRNFLQFPTCEISAK